MQERIDQLDGTLRILSSRGTESGTVIEVGLPLSHLLPPGEDSSPAQLP
jgi:two-component system NarL family sensor kinase